MGTRRIPIYQMVHTGQCIVIFILDGICSTYIVLDSLFLGIYGMWHIHTILDSAFPGAYAMGYDHNIVDFIFSCAYAMGCGHIDLDSIFPSVMKCVKWPD